MPTQKLLDLYSSRTRSSCLKNVDVFVCQSPELCGPILLPNMALLLVPEIYPVNLLLQQSLSQSLIISDWIAGRSAHQQYLSALPESTMVSSLAAMTVHLHTHVHLFMVFFCLSRDVEAHGGHLSPSISNPTFSCSTLPSSPTRPIHSGHSCRQRFLVSGCHELRVPADPTATSKVRWLNGRASDYESGGSRFDPWVDRQ